MRGPWSAAEIDAFLDDARIPIRLGCTGASGAPVVLSLWFLPRDGALWCATQRDARVVSFLSGDPRCAFEVAADTAPYRGVRGQGRASLDTARGPEVLRGLVDRYLGTEHSPFARWLLSRSENEVAIRIEPERLRSWDFTERMTATPAATAGAA